MPAIEIVDLADEARFGLIPPCADPSFDHRSCDYWEDADRGSKASRPGWLGAGSTGSTAGSTSGSTAGPVANPFAPPPKAEPNPFLPSSTAAANPFAPAFTGPAQNPFLEDRAGSIDDNPFAPRRPARPTVAAEAPRKLQLLGRGLAVFGTYAKLLLVDGKAAGYCQFGPLSAYPRALRTRQLYPKLPDAPLPAVITCIATTADARRSGLALRLVQEVCDDLAGRGFAAVEAYPEVVAREDATPAARPEFWIRAGFTLAVADDRYPVVRREL
jgi:ribosomal protein S18 acetylase RimI-like enzyme